MYFLVLLAFLQLDTLAPKVYSKHSTALECEAAMKSRLAENAAELAEDEAQKMGLTFACLRLVTV